MSWYDGVPAAALSIGPPSSFAAVAAATAGTQMLMVGATGDYYVPVIPAGFFQFGKQGQLLVAHFAGTVTAAAVSTTMTVAIGVNSTLASISGTTVPGVNGLIYQSVAGTIGTTAAGQGWELDVKAYTRGTGYGTISASTSLMTMGILSFGVNGQAVGNTLTQPVTTIDASVANYLYATVAFSAASSGNVMQVQHAHLYGMA